MTTLYTIIFYFKKELLPFVSDGVDDDDEVLLALALSLGRMVEHVGGPSHAQALLRPLELLLTVEETAVRQAASDSTRLIAAVLPPDVFQTDYATMLARLATKEWFTARASAAHLLALAFENLSVQQLRQQHLDLYCQLCRDDVPMVRRIAAKYLGTMVQSIVRTMGRDVLQENGVVAVRFMPLYEEFASNEQPDSVRLQTSENCVAFGQALSDCIAAEHETNATGQLRECETHLLKRVLPLIVATTDDRSWRVRWTAAAKFAMVVQAYDALPDAMDALIPAYEKLLQDPEAEVRTAATFNLAHVAKCKAMVMFATTGNNRSASASSSHNDSAKESRVSVAERLVKRVTSLTEDDSEHVRAALAMVATELAPILGTDATITYLVPPVLLLLRDPASEVRLNLISSLSALNEVIGVDLLSQSLLPAIVDLAHDGKWRIRLAIIELIPLLSKQLGRDFFTEKLATLCVGWLGDDIATIRTAAAANLKDLTALFGAEWAIENLIPSIVNIREHESYLRRLTALQACSMMATEMDADTATLEVLPLVLEMATDGVPNIRFNVAKELETIALVCGVAAYESQILPVLSTLMNDDDRDVRFHADKAAAFLDKEFSERDDEGS
jgi:serine/threonine-protein phosphatase 2A regulatory subunit A